VIAECRCKRTKASGRENFFKTKRMRKGAILESYTKNGSGIVPGRKRQEADGCDIKKK